MKIEHLALNVEDPLSVARWYVDHLGFTIKRRVMKPPWVHFLADDSGSVMLELYGNPEAAITAFGEIEPLSLHLALVSEDIEADVERLAAAGAVPLGEIDQNPSGDRLVMIRDPWGFCLQLVQRSEPLV